MSDGRPGTATDPVERLALGPCFWLLAGLLALLAAQPLTRELDRPYFGLHGLDQAHNAWLARAHVTYGLGYTHGYGTFAVGDPPPAAPERYLDHPPLYALLNAAAMALLGVDESTLRWTNMAATAVALLLFLALVRRLADETTAVLAGVVFASLPLVGYFGVEYWLYPVVFAAYLRYLDTVERPEPAPPSARRLVPLAALLFLAVQIAWVGCFFAAALGIDELVRAARARRRPEPRTLAVVTVVPAISLAIDFLVLAAGGGWDFRRLAELAAWRAGAGERATHEWGPWFARLGEHAVADFTWPVLLLAAAYALAAVWIARRARSRAEDGPAPRLFPGAALLLVPALFQVFVLKGTVWEHEWWLRPLAPPLALAAGLALARVHRGIARRSTGIAALVVTLAVATLFLAGARGTDRFYAARGYYAARLEMFESLRDQMRPDQALLSFESYRFDQRPGVKPASLRPEVAWHLDRPIDVARRPDEIAAQGATGRYAFYLMPAEHRDPEVGRYLAWLRDELRRRYPGQLVRADPDQWVFDLRVTAGSGERR